jgi:hypothetical protein
LAVDRVQKSIFQHPVNPVQPKSTDFDGLKSFLGGELSRVFKTRRDAVDGHQDGFLELGYLGF